VCKIWNNKVVAEGGVSLPQGGRVGAEVLVDLSQGRRGWEGGREGKRERLTKEDERTEKFIKCTCTHQRHHTVSALRVLGEIRRGGGE